MWTKICGTTNLDDAQLAAELGADAIGFVFAQSKRQVTAEQVAAITPKLPSSIEKVGVFDRPDVRWIVESAERAGLTAVQLHFVLEGNEPALTEFLHRLQVAFDDRVRLIGVIGVEAGEVSLGAEQRLRGELAAALARPELFAVLLDTARGARSGGLGEPFDWVRVAEALEAARREAEPHILEAEPHLVLAGGLNAENVERAVHTLHPWGADVVSGVEAAPGTKSPERLNRFLQITRNL